MTSPLEPQALENSIDFAVVCHSNMLTIASQEVIYFASCGHYTENLEDLELSGLTCPECGEEYFLDIGEGDYFYIECPIPHVLNHGNIHNGVPSWPPDIEDEEDICRNTMCTIVSEEAIYFAEHETYTENLEDLGLGESVCPECKDTYLMQVYDEGFSFRVECPLPSDPNHGNIDNGVASWWEEQGSFQEACRANMRTIASQEVIYFACNDRYTENLQDLGLSGVVCPAFGETYILLVQEYDEFYLACPLHGWANHGNIDNGVASW